MAWVFDVSLIFVKTGECDPEICRLVSQRGNGVMRLYPVWERKALEAFLRKPCPRCGQQVRVATEPVNNVAAYERAKIHHGR